MDIQSKYDLLPFPNDYHYGSDILPPNASANSFTNMPMIKPGEFGKDSHYCSSTYTSELDPIISQQIGKVPKPDIVLPKNVMPIPNEDNADEDILNKMDAMDLSHTRLLTEGVLSTDDHEYLLNSEDFSDYKNAQRRKTIELEG
ncbi:hypothetical protein niasHT_014703 [Heterodera trifolii]|uniref:Uncharacterized protein n=1 Tax=Heterodera trifolii TaxID=157864 RepID=A0ABD2KWM1_9BILA